MGQQSALGGCEPANAFIQRLTLVNATLIVETLASFGGVFLLVSEIESTREE
jgi:hypothetical protein